MDQISVDLLRGLGVVGLTCVLFWMLATGRLATGRELREKNATIERLEETVRVQRHQLTLVLNEAMTTISPVLRAMRAAVDADDDPGGEP